MARECQEHRHSPAGRGWEAGLSHRRSTYKAVSQTSLACLILITPLGVGCYYSILLGANKIMLWSHYIPIRNLLRTHSTRVRKRRCLSQPRQPGPGQMEDLAWRSWGGERGHREWTGGAGGVPPARAPGAGACQAPRREVGRGQENRNGGESEAERGP